MAKKILICDDSDLQVAMLSKWLTGKGYQVVQARDGNEGLSKTLTEKPDLIVLDVMMPKITGYEFVQKLKQAGGPFKKIPIIVITGKKSMGDFFGVADIQGFLVKGFSEEEFLSKIEKAVGSAELQTSIKKSETRQKAFDGHGEKVLIAGVEDYPVGKLEKFLEGSDFFIQTALDEDSALSKLKHLKPEVFICQYWEDPASFNTQKVIEEAQQLAKISPMQILVFCQNALSIEASKDLTDIIIIPFESIDDLMAQLRVKIKI